MDYIANMDANANAYGSVIVSQRVHDTDRGRKTVKNAGKFRKNTITDQLEYPTFVCGDDWIANRPLQGLDSFQCADFVLMHQRRESDDIESKDCRQPPLDRFGHQINILQVMQCDIGGNIPFDNNRVSQARIEQAQPFRFPLHGVPLPCRDGAYFTLYAPYTAGVIPVCSLNDGAYLPPMSVMP